MGAASCGNAERTISDRIEGVGKDCGFLASEAALNTAGMETGAYCTCMVGVLESWPESDAAAVSHTLAYMSKQTRETGARFEELTEKVRRAAKAPDAANAAISLGIGVEFVDDLIDKVGKRASNNNC